MELFCAFHALLFVRLCLILCIAAKIESLMKPDPEHFDKINYDSIKHLILRLIHVMSLFDYYTLIIYPNLCSS